MTKKGSDKLRLDLGTKAKKVGFRRDPFLDLKASSANIEHANSSLHQSSVPQKVVRGGEFSWSHTIIKHCQGPEMG